MNAEEKLLLENQVCFPLYSAANAVIRAYRPLLDALDLT
ncbi:transcriptional regulator OhrR domain protein, partial [Vibrio parahaemolyticus V-223/04]